MYNFTDNGTYKNEHEFRDGRLTLLFDQRVMDGIIIGYEMYFGEASVTSREEYQEMVRQGAEARADQMRRNPFNERGEAEQYVVILIAYFRVVLHYID
jgi:hypothetical protein